MKILHEPTGDRFFAECTYEERLVPKEAGFRWDPGAKIWWTDDVAKAARLRQFAEADAVEVINRWEQRFEENLEASRAEDADIEIPAPTDLDYLPYQKAGIAFALRVFGDDK